MPDESAPPSLAVRIAARLRAQIMAGHLAPGARLSEARLAADLDVSRNTLREAFRLLVQDGLLVHAPHRGVSVARPGLGAIIEIYRLRRLIELPCLARAWPGHPTLLPMAEAVAQARAAREAGDWRGVGSANMDFHAGIVALADSPRLTGFFAGLMTELRLAFGLLPSPERLHAPFLRENGQILDRICADRIPEAQQRLSSYLDESERMVVEALARLEPGQAGG